MSQHSRSPSLSRTLRSLGWHSPLSARSAETAPSVISLRARPTATPAHGTPSLTEGRLSVSSAPQTNIQVGRGWDFLLCWSIVERDHCWK